MNEHHFNIEIVQGHGGGQGSCCVCTEDGIWNRHWMCLLKEITVDSKPIHGCFCSKHALLRALYLDRVLNGGDLDD